MLSLVAAVARGGAMGLAGGLPWTPPADDMARFKALTLGHPVIMGRRTWDSLDLRPLPGRENVVLSRDPAFAPEGCRTARSLEEALAPWGEGEVFVIGGAEIYALALPRAGRLHLTLMDLDCEADAFFPPLPEGVFAEVSREPGCGDPPHAFVVLDRIK
jgi:dihydrofolate reductase